MPCPYSHYLHQPKAGCLRRLRGILLTLFFLRCQGPGRDNGVYEELAYWSRPAADG
jgi:hypothetical protein